MIMFNGSGWSMTFLKPRYIYSEINIRFSSLNFIRYHVESLSNLIFSTRDFNMKMNNI